MKLPEAQLAIARENPPYSVRLGSAIHDDSIAIQLWREGGLGSSGGDSVDRARYKWFYLENPEGVARVNLALSELDGQVIGFLGIGPRRFYLRSQEITAGTLVDFVVSPRHRSLYPAMLLQRQGRAEALLSMQMLYGMPDTKAVAICKRLGSEVNFDLHRYVRVVGSKTYLERWAPKWVVAPLAFLADTLDGIAMSLQLALTPFVTEWVDGFDARFDRLWQQFDKSALCIGERGSAFLDWRFKRQPGHSHRTFIVRRKNSADILTYFICEHADGSLRVKDCLSMGTEAEFKSSLLLLSREARRLGFNSVEVQIAATQPIRRALKRAQFFIRSSRPFFAMINAPFRAAANASWYITPADEDV